MDLLAAVNSMPHLLQVGDSLIAINPVKSYESTYTLLGFERELEKTMIFCF
ncbi:MAG: hypothetical protein ACE5KO_03165 [Candidatus Bathyarchaeia archaeon]